MPLRERKEGPGQREKDKEKANDKNHRQITKEESQRGIWLYKLNQHHSSTPCRTGETKKKKKKKDRKTKEKGNNHELVIFKSLESKRIKQETKTYRHTEAAYMTA